MWRLRTPVSPTQSEQGTQNGEKWPKTLHCYGILLSINTFFLGQQLHLFTCSFIQSFIHLSIHSFHWWIHWVFFWQLPQRGWWSMIGQSISPSLKPPAPLGLKSFQRGPKSAFSNLIRSPRGLLDHNSPCLNLKSTHSSHKSASLDLNPSSQAWNGPSQACSDPRRLKS